MTFLSTVVTGIKEVSFKRPAQNLCQLPNHTRLAGWLVFVEKRWSGFKSFTPCVGQDNFQRSPFAKGESMRGRSRLQHSSAQHLPSHRVADPTL